MKKPMKRENEGKRKTKRIRFKAKNVDPEDIVHEAMYEVNAAHIIWFFYFLLKSFRFRIFENTFCV